MVIATFTAIGWRIHYRQLTEERRNVFDHLQFSVALPNEDLRSTRITVTNGGQTDIHYRLVCHVKMLVANGGQTVVQDSFFANHERSGILEAGEDSQADDCLSDISVPTASLDCADIKVRVFYSLENELGAQLEKDHGFIAMQQGGRIEWQDRAASQQISDCTRFVRSRPLLDPDHQLAENARNIELLDQEILQTHGVNPAKQTAANLSASIFKFGLDMESDMPRSPDLEKTGPLDPEYQKQFSTWARTTARQFHSNFDIQLQRTFKSARSAGLRLNGAETNCTIVSESFPPTIDQTQRCGILIGWIAFHLPTYAKR